MADAQKRRGRDVVNQQGDRDSKPNDPVYIHVGDIWRLLGLSENGFRFYEIPTVNQRRCGYAYVSCGKSRQP